jgi:hypothetical protein
MPLAIAGGIRGAITPIARHEENHMTNPDDVEAWARGYVERHRGRGLIAEREVEFKAHQMMSDQDASAADLRAVRRGRNLPQLYAK